MGGLRYGGFLSIIIIIIMGGLRKMYILSFREKGQVVLLGDFSDCVGRSVEVDDVIGMLGEW